MIKSVFIGKTFNLVDHMVSHFVLIIGFSCLVPFYAISQSKHVKVELIHADTYEFDKLVNKDAKRLIGNVHFRHEGSDMYCDSAYLFEENNSIEAFRNVKIVKGDSINMKGNFLHYNGNQKLARLFENVIMTDKKLTLTTDSLVYDREREVVFYPDRGKTVDSENTLISDRGYYFIKEKSLYFKNNVTMYNKRFQLKCDTLKYNTQSKLAFFLGPTNIESYSADTARIYCEYGWYNTSNDNSFFSVNSSLKQHTQTIKADSIFYYKRNGSGKAFGHVSISDSVERVIINGQKAEMNEFNNSAWITGQSTLIQISGTDSMFLHADTLSVKSESANINRCYLAYYGVKLFNKDLQAKCDSLSYTTHDSMMHFLGSPVLWSDNNQVTADTITLQMANNKPHKMYLYNLSMVSMKEDSIRFSQIKGRNMIADFKNNTVSSIKVEGNSQTIYYGRNSKNKYVGVNRAESSEMYIEVDSNKVKRISMMNKPDATFYPISELSPSELFLKGFVWREKEKPLRKEDIYIK